MRTICIDSVEELINGPFSAEGLYNKNMSYVVKNFASEKEVQKIKDEFIESEKTAKKWEIIKDSTHHFHVKNTIQESRKIKQCTARTQFMLFNNPPEAILEIAKRIFDTKLHLEGKAAMDAQSLTARPSSGRFCMASVSHYPLGGGQLGKHADPESNVGGVHAILMLTTIGRDFKNGGLIIYDISNKNAVNIDEIAKKGDLVLFHSQTHFHEVEPIDENDNFTWDLTKGRKSFSPVIIQKENGIIVEPIVKG